MVRGQQDLSSFGQEPIGSGRRVLDVGEVAAIIDELLLDERLIECRVRGEITNCKHHTSGHCYFSLSGERDGEPAQVPCVCWRRDAARLKDELRDGRTVIAFGSIANYAAGGRYQFYVCDVERAGIGEKFLQVERWRRELAKEGCFSEEKKRPLPRFPTRVGVVTSPTGAVLHDILNVLGRRFPVEVLLSPTPVQGDGAEVEIAAAIGRVDGRADVIIVARGGGSFEDLFCFNHPLVVHAVHASGPPVVSAIGHEVDVTLCDLAADLRAPTPSAAAELVAPDRSVLQEELRQARRRLSDLLHARWQRADDDLQALRDRLRPARLGFRINRRREELSELSDRLERSARRALERRETDLAGLAAVLRARSPFEPLSRGYALVELHGRPVTSAGALAPGDRVRARFGKGEAALRVEEVYDDEEDV
ncbi:MAG TPA: exodeoxyribonuclease VII large subunit [Methanoregulaceae archaeon]|nr:exodeoxyribonuclease VII large subunit [Methanoregulaceae archaeon]HQJ87243.1 exodeoxyribonuclease VII large subunit [Methanoregulaceae archaeon]